MVIGSAKRVANYINGLTIGQGRHAGRPFTLLPWQRRFLQGAFGQPDDAGLTLGRGCGKTTLVAAIAAATVDIDGPLVEPMAETLVVASSFDQGLIAYRHIQNFLRPSIEAHKGRFRIQDSANRATITDRETGAMVRVLGSDPRRLHGSAPKLLLFDELAQWPHTQIEAMLAALRTSRGKIADSRALWIGTRAADPEHPFERALQGGLGYVQVHAAQKDDPPFQARTWRKANPSLRHMPDLEKMIRQEATAAKRDGSLLQQFKALRLNMGVADVEVSLLLDAGLWTSCEGEAEASGPCVWGIDLGTSAAQSAVACYWPSTGRLECIAAFPCEPPLNERGLRDGVGNLYQVCAVHGELLTLGHRASDVPALLQVALDRFGRPSVVVADRWREAELRDALDKAGVPSAELDVRGMGFKDGAEDVRAFRRAMADGRVTPIPSLLLRSAMSEARTVSDPAGNSKLSKATQGGRRKRARDDAAAAAILAVAAGARRPAQPKPRWRYRGMAG